MAKSTVTMSLHGFEAIQRAITQAPEQLKDLTADAVEKTTFATAQRMKATVKVKSGKLKRSITAKSRGLNGRVLIEPDAFYWRFLEYGTVHMSARPFVRPAAEAEDPHYIERLRAVCKKLEQLWPKGAV
jgi:HK97 gp10 family phage protein